MSDPQAKSTPQPTSEQPQHPQPIYGIQQPAGAPYAAVGTYPPYYPYSHPPADGNGTQQDHNVPNPAPPGTYMMAFPPPPPGMIYAYPTAQGYPAMPFPAGLPLPAALVRPKRKQVKMACTNCAAACKRCDEGRPCERCCKYGISDSCQDGVRKERKKGIKRGPYKRKGKVNPDQTYEGFPQEQNPATTEGFYPYFYPPPFIPIGPDGQPMQPDPNAVAQPGMPPPPQYYPIHPAAYPPFAAYPHTGAYPTVMAGHMMAAPPPANGEAPANQSADPSKAAGSGQGQKDGHENGDVNNATGGTSPPARGKKKGKGVNKDDAAGNSSGNATKKAGKKAAQPGPEGNGSTSVVSG